MNSVGTEQVVVICENPCLTNRRNIGEDKMFCNSKCHQNTYCKKIKETSE